MTDKNQAAPKIEAQLVNPLVNALTNQRNMAQNIAAEFEARCAVVMTQNAALREEVDALNAQIAKLKLEVLSLKPMQVAGEAVLPA